MRTLRDKSILVVDDDANMLCALDKVLTREGMVVTCAGCAEDAVDILIGRKKSIDLVITDLRMPHVSGMTVIFAIHEMRPALPIIVLTAFGSPYVKTECLQQGAAAFLEKPVDTPQLLAVIDRVLSSQADGAETENSSWHGAPAGESNLDEKAGPQVHSHH
jgi:DNA-binding NtrC family response regulator